MPAGQVLVDKYAYVTHFHSAHCASRDCSHDRFIGQGLEGTTHKLVRLGRALAELVEISQVVLSVVEHRLGEMINEGRERQVH
jgi:hypothetical protein